MDPDILNAALGFAMEFGKNWLQPIHDRLATMFPVLSPSELNQYDHRCRQVMTFANAQIPILWRQSQGRQKEAFDRFQEALLGQYPWLSQPNLNHLFSQGCYYAYKDGQLG